MSEANRVAELEALWRELREECIKLREEAQRSEAGRKVVLRAMQEAHDALAVGRAKEALLILREALRD